MSLAIFLWFYIACLSISVLCRLLFLSYKSYPRLQYWTRGEDALSILFHAGFAVWAFTVLP